MSVAPGLRRRRFIGAACAPAATMAAAAALAGCAAPARRAVAPPPLPREAAAQVVFTAMAFVDTPYRRGGSGGGSDEGGADGFDCSGFTRHVYERSLGLVLPRTAWDQAHAPALAEVDAADLQPGDLVFFNTLQRAHSHVGIYVGAGRFIHAPRPGTRVRVEEMAGTAGSYWVRRFDGARRVVPAAAPATPPLAPR